ncbi:MAG TPA: DUF2130 domain-containing protein [Candidatus Moranbacteria bacterium]|nr:DUF2130 domain-containing protein [Candidatus Moranbacteria bacterium]
MKNQSQIKCPNCGTSIDVQDILAHQLEEEIKQKFQSQLAEEKKKYETEFERLNKAKEEFEQKKKQENNLFQERLENQLKEEKKAIEEKIKIQLQEEQSEQFKVLQAELNEKSEQIKELNRTRAEIEKLKREKGELKEAIEAEAQKKLNEALIVEREKIRKTEADNNELRFKELQKQLEDQKKLTEEMKRKQEQGSMQMQGEVQELAIEEWLASQFPLDTIEEIKKGARGGDCLQFVNTRNHQNCGTIYYESKRTKDFQPSWIEKFKADIRDKGANIGVLVTEVMPSDMDRMGLKDGIWICNYGEFKGLCAVLRESIIQVSTAISSQENKGDKMDMLYTYLTSNTFRMQIEAIVEGFTQMKTDLESEKRSMQRIWKQRDKQIEKVVTNTIDMYGSIKGIAGNAIQSVKALELPSEDNEEPKLELE